MAACIPRARLWVVFGMTIGFPLGFPWSFGGGPPWVDVPPPPEAETFTDEFVPSLAWVDHCREGLSKLLHQFQGRPGIETLLCTWLAKVQEVENTFWALKLLRGLYTSTGAQLDTIGAIVGEPDRAGDIDSDYRLRILARIAVNLSNGRREDMLSVLSFILGETFPVQVWEFYPASMAYYITGLPVSALDLYAILTDTKAAGVRLFLVWSAYPSEEVFSGDSVYATVTAPGQYPGTVYDVTIGGVAASVFG